MHHGTASTHHQGLSMQCTQASCGCLLMKTAWPMLFPPGTMPREIEGQEFTVLETKEQKNNCIRRQPVSTNHRLKWGRMKGPISLHLFLLGFSCKRQEQVSPNFSSRGKPDFVGPQPSYPFLQEGSLPDKDLRIHYYSFLKTFIHIPGQSCHSGS